MASMLGKATYLDEESEEAWASFVKDWNDWLEKQETIPVSSAGLFPTRAELLAEGGKSQAELEDIYTERGFTPPTPTDTHRGYYNRTIKDGDVSHFLSVTGKGEELYKKGEEAPKVHEYFHYLDKIMNTGANDFPTVKGMAGRMAAYNKDGSLSAEEMLEAWMNDPETEHLNLDNPENKGLRTLLKNRLHHGGVVDVREGVGKFLSTMLNDEQYNNWMKERESKGQDTSYLAKPTEMLADAGQSIVNEVQLDKDLKKYNMGWGTDWDKTLNNATSISKDLADSIATYLNARELEEKGWL
jgi:hypothetical protein